MSTVLIDKITIAIPISEFKVSELPGDCRPFITSEGTDLIFYSIDDQPFYGAKFSFNIENIGLTFYPQKDFKKGYLYITFNPANEKGFNLRYLNHKEFYRYISSIESTLSAYISFLNKALYKAKLVRLDLAKDITPDRIFEEYIPLFKKLQASRMLPDSRFSTSYMFKNKSREIIFYDKIAELLNKKGYKDSKLPERLMRIELRLLKPKLIKDNLFIDSLHDLLGQKIYKSLGRYFNESISELIFKTSRKNIKLSPLDDIGNNNLAIMRYLKAHNHKDSVYKYFVILALGEGGDMVISELRDLMKNSDFNKASISKSMRKLKDLMEIRSQLLSKTSDSMASMYNELKSKLVN